MRRKHTLVVRPRDRVEGSAGQSELGPLQDPVNVLANVRPLSADEIIQWGDRGRDTRKVFCDSWPGSMDATIAWGGASWDQVAPEQVFDYGTATQHVELIIRKR
jgi:hypothetical protein